MNVEEALKLISRDPIPNGTLQERIEAVAIVTLELAKKHGLVTIIEAKENKGGV